MSVAKQVQGIVPASPSFGWPSLRLNVAALLAVVASAMAVGVKYKLGGKASSLSQTAGGPHGYSAIDCSGFVRVAVFQASGVIMPDGSVVQHDWVKAKGFKVSSVAAGKEKDGAVRIAFLSQQDGGGGVGHVALIHNGQTIESHGGKGPNRRPWTGLGWQAKAKVYVLLPPTPPAPSS